MKEESEKPMLDPALSSLVMKIRSHPKLSEPDAEMLELSRSLSSTPLAAFAESLATHPWSVNFGEFEVTAESLEENGFYDDIVEALSSLGLADSEGICIGNDGGGAEALLMVADSNKPGGYTICRFAYDGNPYSNGEPIEELGQLADMLRTLMLSFEIDVELQNIPGVNKRIEQPESATLKWVEAPPLPALELTEGERRTFEGCDERFFTRATNGALAGHHPDPTGEPPPHLAGALNQVLRTTLILASGDSTTRFGLDFGEKLRWIKPSPSGSAFLVYFETDRQRSRAGTGHAVEYAVDGTERIAITATEPCGKSYRLLDVAYAGDDDLMVALVDVYDGYLLLLARDPATGDFFEVDNIAASKGVSLASSNGVVVVSTVASSNLVYYGVVGHRLVKINGPETPDPQASLQATFGANGAEVRMIGTQAEYVLDTASGLKNASATPRADGIYLRRVTGDTPAFLSPQEEKELFQRLYENVGYASGVSFRTPEGRIGACFEGYIDRQYCCEHLLFGPDGEVVFCEKDSPKSWLLAHPTDERALMTTAGELFEVDLRTNERVLLGPRPAAASYLILNGRERLLTVDTDSRKITVWAREALQPLSDSPLAEYDCGDVYWSSRVCMFEFDSFLHPKRTDDGVEYDLVRIVESDDGVTFSSSGPLRFPGKRFYATTYWDTKVINGVGYIGQHETWFVI